MKSISCPVCESRNTSNKYITEECTVYKCQNCTHLFTPENTIIRKESYGSNYYKEVHKNWFDNPHYGLFDLIFLQIKSHFLNYPNFLSLKVLDVGCGKCQLLSYLSDKHGMKNLSGIDLMSMEYEAPSNIDFFNENFLGHKPISKYDVIISTLVIEHVYNANEFLSKIKSMLTPNGIAIIVTNDCSHPLYLSARLLSKLNFKQPLQRMFSSHHVNHFTKKTLKLLSGKVGFRFLRTISVSIPYKSLDIPCENFLQKIIYPYAVYVHLTLGKIINHKFLQMQIYIN